MNTKYGYLVLGLIIVVLSLELFRRKQHVLLVNEATENMKVSDPLVRSRQADSHTLPPIYRTKKRLNGSIGLYDAALENTSSVFNRKHDNDPCPSGTSRKAAGVLIIGAPKCGTEALSVMMNLHPALVSEVDEVRYFNTANSAAKKAYRTNNYASLLPCITDKQIAIDRSARYIWDVRVPRRVFRRYKNMKMILLVRDPVPRLISQFLLYMEYGRFTTDTSLEQVVFKKNTNIVNEKNIMVTISRYYDMMKRWLKYFPLDQFLILSAESVRFEPYATMKKVETFLNLEDVITEDMFEYNSERGFYCYKFEDATQCLRPRKGRPHPAVDENTLEILREYFQPYNEKFYELVNQDFDW